MSMTQEEIEALMNDTVIEEPSKTEDTDIDDLLAGIDGIVDDGPIEESSDDIDDLLAGIDGIVEDEPSVAADDNMDDLLAGIDGIVDDSPAADDDAFNIDEMLSGIDGVVDDIPSPVKKESPKVEAMEDKINKGIYPPPAEHEHKVINQLHEVAEDSEEKASQIFDVLSFILDENDVMQKKNQESLDFIDGQIELLTTLSEKFPNVAIFKENLEFANNTKKTLAEIPDSINGENAKIFEAMELMQFHDINRQKIERVMSVIKKLTNYLNGIFSDDSMKPEVQIAQHISGDDSTVVTEDDLDDLISEFSK